MNILIVEDEQLAQERLQFLVKSYDPSINIIGCLESVEETVNWFNTKPHPDLLLLDIHLSDGESFEIFRRVNIQKPVIFTTAYEHYAVDAFQLFSIDYILKPIGSAALAAALNKYKNLAAVFAPRDYQMVVEQMRDNFSRNYKTRFLAKVGQRLFFVPAADVAYFTADNKIVFLVDKEGNRFLLNMTIEKLESELDPKHFFRLNRKMIVNAAAIQQIKPYQGNRLKLQLNGTVFQDELIISRERVAEFKKWADN